jgi:hypothetical protein
MKKIWIVVIAIAVLIILIAGTYRFYSNIYNAQACTTEAKICPDGTAVGRSGPNCNFATCPTSTTTPVKTFLQNVNIKAGETVKSPLVVTGEARGTWYFEALFPIKMYDSNGKLLGSIPAQAQSDWMTENFVPFVALLVFETPTTDSGMLILEKDNPSGMPQNADQYEIPIKFK